MSALFSKNSLLMAFLSNSKNANAMFRKSAFGICYLFERYFHGFYSHIHHLWLVSSSFCYWCSNFSQICLYYHFIDGYSCVVLLITSLVRTKGCTPIEWSPTAKEVFDRIKSLFTSASILCHFDPDLQITLHSDSSSFALSGILSQPHPNYNRHSLLHPVVY